MYSKLGTAVAILMGAFPFLALGYTIAVLPEAPGDQPPT